MAVLCGPLAPCSGTALSVAGAAKGVSFGTDAVLTAWDCGFAAPSGNDCTLQLVDTTAGLFIDSTVTKGVLKVGGRRTVRGMQINALGSAIDMTLGAGTAVAGRMTK